MTRPGLARPSSRLLALEQLCVLEYGALVPALPFLAALRDGNGSPVLVLPGFTGTDRSTLPLRRILEWRGHSVHGWRLGLNVGPHPGAVEGMQRRFLDLHERYGVPISLVGWSLGGVYARELARMYPDAVRQVVTLGSPFRLRGRDRTSATWLYDAVRPRDDPFFGAPPEEQRPVLPVPTTAIYTRTDGIVRWHACIETAGDRRENIEVVGTHSGLGVNLGAIVAVSDRLAQPDDVWRRFRPPAALRGVYRPPASWRPAGQRAGMAR